MTSADEFTRACPVWKDAIRKGGKSGPAFEITGGSSSSLGLWALLAAVAAVAVLIGVVAL